MNEILVHQLTLINEISNHFLKLISLQEKK